jgi:hypothetical protein
MNDQNRWNEFRKGNQIVLGDIFLMYYDDLFRYSKRWLGDEEQIKDLIQDLFFKLWIKRKNLGETNNIKALINQLNYAAGVFHPAPASPPTNISNGGQGFFMAAGVSQITDTVPEEGNY